MSPRASPKWKRDEVPVVDLAQEAHALAVGAVFGRQVEFSSVGAHLVFVQVADGEADVGQLCLAQVGEKVGLVLDWVGGAAKPKATAGLLDASVVPRSNLVALTGHSLIKGPELDALIAKDVRARRASPAQFGESVLDDLHPVLALAAARS